MNVSGTNKVIKNLNRFADEVGEDMANALFAGGNDVRNIAVKSIQQQSAGKEVTRYRNGGEKYKHVAAAAGQAPNTDTRSLVGSIFVEVDQSDISSGYTVFVGTTLGYGKYLELGTKDMQPRPWLMPAKLQAQPKILKRIKNAVRARIARAGK